MARTFHISRITLSGLFLLAMLGLALVGCGEPAPIAPPPGSTSAVNQVAQTTGTMPTGGGAGTATTTATSAAKPGVNTDLLRQLAALPIVTPRPVIELTTDALQAARTKLPANAPEDAEIVADITPGKRGGRLVYGVAAEPKSFNPLVSTNIGDQEAQGLMFAGLTGYDSYHQRATPGLAKSWEYDPATLTWTFHLRRGLKWSDGQPLTADDFVFFATVIFDANVVNDVHYFLRQEPDVNSPAYQFTAADPHTLKVKIPSPDSFSELNLGLVRPLPKHKLEPVYQAGKITETWMQNIDPKELVVSGPFKLRELRLGEAMIFERNPQYYRYDTEGTQLPYLDELVVTIVRDSNALHLQFLAGDLDLQEGIDPEMLPRFWDEAKQRNFTVYPLGPSLNSNHYWFNTHRGGTFTGADGGPDVWHPTTMGETPPANLKDFKPFVSEEKLYWFSNPEFRIACSEGTNRQKMIDSVLYGLGAPLYGLTSPANKEWYNPEEPTFPYDPAAAKARLDKLGWVDKNGDGLREDDKGRTIRFKVVTSREGRIRQNIVTLIRDDLRAIGLDVNSEVLQFNELIAQVSETFAYDAVLLGLGTGIPPHPAMGGNTWRSAGDNHFGYPNQKVPQTEWEAEVDRLYAAMRATFDPAEQKRLSDEMQRVFNLAQPAIFLFTGKGFVAAKHNIGNLKPTIIRNSVTHNIEELYIQ